MTYIVKDECIKCKLTDCVEVCPVDCFYEGENMLVINPDECIDCGVCELTFYTFIFYNISHLLLINLNFISALSLSGK